MRKLLAWLKSHPSAATFILLVMLGIGGNWFANWRAERRWQSYCDAARARGVKLHLADFVRPEVPDSENFAALPMFRARAPEPFKVDTTWSWNAVPSDIPQTSMSLLNRHGPLPGLCQPLKGKRLDWKEWQQYFKRVGFIADTSDSAPRDVLTALEHYAPQIREWSEWQIRPRSRFPVNSQPFSLETMPWVSLVHDGVKLFSLRMRAHLELGDSAAAYADFRDGLQGYLALKDEPFLPLGLTRIAILSELTTALGEGLSEHRWTESELRKIESDLAGIQIWEDYRFTFSSQRGSTNAVLDEYANASLGKRKKLFSAMTGSDAASWICALPPRWYFRVNQLRVNQNFDELIARVSADGSAFNLDAPNPSNPINITGTFDTYYFFPARIGAPALNEVSKRYVTAGTKLWQARIACAAERFYLANGAYPESLADLIPKFVAEAPMDIYSGKMMIYRRKGAGSFLLYSVGQNRIDDQGIIDPKKTETGQLDDVWLYAPASAH